MPSPRELYELTVLRAEAEGTKDALFDHAGRMLAMGFGEHDVRVFGDLSRSDIRKVRRDHMPARHAPAE